MTANEFFTTTYEEQQKNNYRRTTANTRNYGVRHHLLNKYADKELSAFRPKDINAIYKGIRNRGLSEGTVYAAQAVLMSFFHSAVESGVITENPVKGAEHIRPLWKRQESKTASNMDA